MRVIRVETLSRSAKALLPPHNRISCYAALSTAACAAFIKESRMKPVETTKLGRKSGTCGGFQNINAGAPTASALSRFSPQDQQTKSNFNQAISGPLRYFYSGAE
jgi:hypothetical protein